MNNVTIEQAFLSLALLNLFYLILYIVHMHCMKGEGGVFYYRPNILLAVVCLFLRANKFRYSFILVHVFFLNPSLKDHEAGFLPKV